MKNMARAQFTPIEPQLRDCLGARYREQFVQLQGLIQRDLSAWL